MNVIRFSVLFILVLTSFGAACAQKAVGKEFTSEEFKFKVTFPGTGDVKRPEARTLPEGVMNSFAVEPQPGLSYIVMVANDPNSPINPSDEQIRAKFRAGISKAGTYVKGTVISEREFKLEGLLGDEFVFDSGEYLITCRMYVWKQKFYQVMAVVSKSLAKDPGSVEITQRFLDSFRLV